MVVMKRLRTSVKCELCNIYNSTYYFENKKIAIIDCNRYHIPLVVFKKHRGQFPAPYVDMAVQKCRELFGEEITFKWERRLLPDHAHFHVENAKTSNVRTKNRRSAKKIQTS